MTGIFTPHQLDRMRIRRRMAVVSFLSILITLSACFGVVFLGDESTASNMQAVSPIIISIVSLLTGIIINYYYQSHIIPNDKDKTPP